MGFSRENTGIEFYLETVAAQISDLLLYDSCEKKNQPRTVLIKLAIIRHPALATRARKKGK